MKRYCSSALIAAAFLCAATDAGAADPTPKKKARLIGSDGPGIRSRPVWSRDGRALAYERIFPEEQKIELLIVRDLAAGTEEKISPQISGAASSDEVAAWAAAFLRDGRKKETARLAQGQVCRDFSWGPAVSASTYVYSCNATNFQIFWSGGGQITDSDAAAGDPAWSPTAWRLAYVSALRGRGEIYLLDDLLSTSAIAPRLLVPAGEDVALGPVWDHEGRRLAYVSHGKKGEDLFVIQDLAKPKETTKRLTDWPGFERGPSWSPDGKQLAFFATHGPSDKPNRTLPAAATGGDARMSIWLIDTAGAGAAKKIAEDVVAPEKLGPAWTPDGRWIIFAKNDPRLANPLMAIEIATGRQILLATGTVSNADPSVGGAGDDWKLAFSALGSSDNLSREWRRIFVYGLEELRPAPKN